MEGDTMTYHIEGRRWFQRTHGNTYHSVRIFHAGEQIAFCSAGNALDKLRLRQAGHCATDAAS